MAAFLFQGISGKRYAYLDTSWQDSTLSAEHGIYILAKGTVTDPVPVFIRDAISLRAALALDLVQRNTAQSVHGASLLFVRSEPDMQKRLHETLDLVAGYQPVMNVPTSHEE